jgi:hypothetical protein
LRVVALVVVVEAYMKLVAVALVALELERLFL